MIRKNNFNTQTRNQYSKEKRNKSQILFKYKRNQFLVGADIFLTVSTFLVGLHYKTITCNLSNPWKRRCRERHKLT